MEFQPSNKNKDIHQTTMMQEHLQGLALVRTESELEKTVDYDSAIDILLVIGRTGKRRSES